MSIFKNDMESKRVIFNISSDLADRLEAAKQLSRQLGKRLDADTPVNKSLEKFLKKAEKKLAELLEEAEPAQPGVLPAPDDSPAPSGEDAPLKKNSDSQDLC